MWRDILHITAIICLTVLCACSPKVSTRNLTSDKTGTPGDNGIYWDPLPMEVDDECIAYRIDVSTESGKEKLKKLSLTEAQDLVLEEAIKSYNCDVILNATYSHLILKGKILYITLYGYPARYKKQ